MAAAALMSGIALTNAGLGAVHGFAAPLGASFPVPHGTVCGVLLPPVLAANVAALRAQSPGHPTLARYARVGRTLTGRADLPEEQAADACEEFTRGLVRRLGLPPLREFGLTENDVPELVRLANTSSSMKYNPVKLSDETLAGVLRAACELRNRKRNRGRARMQTGFASAPSCQARQVRVEDTTNLHVASSPLREGRTEMKRIAGVACAWFYR